MTRRIGILMEIARTSNVAIVVIRHTPKSGGGGEDLLDVAGSYAVLARQTPERRWNARGVVYLGD